MSQLLEFKVKPFEAIHFRQSGRLVSTDNLVIEKQKALARRAAFAQSHKQYSGPDMDYIRKVNNAFASGNSVAKASDYTPKAASYSLASSMALKQAAQDVSVQVASQAEQQLPTNSEPVLVYPSEPQAVYTQQRGSFEVRVASGDVTYIPAIEMTIITSWPDVEFTYTGGFNYVPPRDDVPGTDRLNLTI